MKPIHYSLTPLPHPIPSPHSLTPFRHIAIISMGVFLAALDQTVVVTALWSISNDLNIPITEIDKAAWIVTAYLLGYTVALPLMGRVADLYGQRRVYLFSLGLFMLGSLMCALSQDLAWLIGARVVQAVGGGAVLPVSMAMARHLFGSRRVPFVLGMLGAVAEAGGVIGPLWGALIMKNLNGVFGVIGWRWIFWINLPLGLLFGALVFLTPKIPRFPGKVDWLGAGLLGGGLLALALGLATPGSVGAWVGLSTNRSSSDASLLTPQGVALLVIALVLFVLFIAWQRRTSNPLIPPELFTRRNWPFSAANLTNALVGAALIITMVNVPLYVASVLDGTTEQGGLMLLRMTAFIPIGAVAGGLLGVHRSPKSKVQGPKSKVQSPGTRPWTLDLGPSTAPRWIAIAGLLVAAAGFWEMQSWTTTSADSFTTWVGLALNGLGFGLLISPVTATALQWGGLARAALSAASVNLSRMIGMMVSLSALTALGLRHFQGLMLSHPAVLVANLGESAAAFAARQADYTAYYKWASLQVFTSHFMAGMIICLVAIAFAIWLRRNPAADIEPGPIF